ncbi:MAG: ribosome-associated translation inhibitor RaiA [Pseudomonadota bacterium]
MQLTVKGKHIDVGDALRSHVEESLQSTATKYFNNAVDASVVLSREKHLFHADLKVHVGKNMQMQTNGEADGPYAAFDKAADKMAKRLRRYKRRLIDHHKHGHGEPAIEASSFVLQAEVDERPDGQEEPDQPVVIAEMTEPVDTLTVSEAVMRLDLGELPALMFRNRAHGGLNMIYRRRDGNVGWVDPRGTRETTR